MYPEFSVPGVPQSRIWELFNASTFEYYCNKVETILSGVCPFCVIDPIVNRVLFENDSWRGWVNKMAPRSGQEYQLIVPSKRHFERAGEQTPKEVADFYQVLQWAEANFSGDGVWVARSGNPRRNAKSVSHYHNNFHCPNGVDRVEVTIAKSEEDLLKKVVILELWERMRVAQEEGNPNPITVLDVVERALVEGRITPSSTRVR